LRAVIPIAINIVDRILYLKVLKNDFNVGVKVEVSRKVKVIIFPFSTEIDGSRKVLFARCRC
jgi:hypothetical protein